MNNRMYNQTVTVYHADTGNKVVTRTVLHGVFCQHGRRELPDTDGTHAGAVLLLVVPEESARYGVDYTLQPADRLLLGEGEELAWEDRARFVPAENERLAVVQYVLPMRLNGKLHHVEAGAWWSGSGTGAHSLTN